MLLVMQLIDLIPSYSNRRIVPSCGFHPRSDADPQPSSVADIVSAFTPISHHFYHYRSKPGPSQPSNLATLTASLRGTANRTANAPWPRLSLQIKSSATSASPSLAAASLASPIRAVGFSLCQKNQKLTQKELPARRQPSCPG